MKVISSTLDLTWESWDDPGDYPNNVAGRPLPSYSYPVVEGEIVFEAESQEDIDSFQDLSEWVDDYIDLGISQATWKTEVKDNRCTAWIEDCEASPPEPYYPEPNYSNWDDS